MSFKITNGGALTTIQDLGRTGFMHSGFSQNGAMDNRSAILANLLVGNIINEAVLEITLTGATIIIDDNCIIAVTGGNCNPLVNNRPILMNTATEIKAGQILRMPLVVNGCRSYLAVSGGFDIPIIMESASTNLKCKIGGFYGRKLEKGDIIHLKNPKVTIKSIANRTLPYVKYSNEISVRVVLGPQDFMFTDDAVKALKSTTFIVSPQSDRMGIRLMGESIQPITTSDIISDGIAMGSIQVPASGQPIIMMSDRQTTGGYAKIATVISADIPLLAQCRPGDKISFETISVFEAQDIFKQKENETATLVSEYEVR